VMADIGEFGPLSGSVGRSPRATTNRAQMLRSILGLCLVGEEQRSPRVSQG
jgi:hypothetical protein